MSAQTDRYQNAVARCFEAWNAREPGARAKTVADAWAPQGGCADLPPEGGPPADVRGHEGITAVVTAAQEQFPGFAFRLTGTVGGHHDTARFSWEPVSEADGAAPVAGSGVITLDADDRVVTVLGFPDRVPAGA